MLWSSSSKPYAMYGEAAMLAGSYQSWRCLSLEASRRRWRV
jgi:hypothetical protein